MNDVGAGTNTPSFGLNGDGLVNDADKDVWLSEAATENGLSAPCLPGDTNLDLHVDVGDLNNVGLGWRSGSNNWSDGNVTGAGVDPADLNVIGRGWQTWHPHVPMPADAVPEPGNLVLVLAERFGQLCVRRR